MKGKSKISKGPILIVVGLIFVAALVFILVHQFEGGAPTLTFSLSSAAIGNNTTLDIKAADEKSGLRRLWVALLQDGRETVLVDKHYPSAGLFAGGLDHEEKLSITLDPKGAGLKNGKAVLRFMVRDFSWRKWWKGNPFYQEQEIVIDTVPPDIDVISKVHYLAQGGSGLVVYKLSEQCATSGVQVGDNFFPGWAGHFADSSIYMAFIAVAFNQPTNTTVFVTARDYAGNLGRSGLAYRINGRRFKHDRIPISDQFLQQKMPGFRSQIGASAAESDLDVFLKVNGDLRKANYLVLQKITSQCEQKIYWQNAFLRLPGAATRAGFADHRTYTYHGKQIDIQDHMGIDLASISQAAVPAANGGKVVFTEALGIYGNTVVIDHGFGLFSMYSHLSHISAVKGQMVQKGDIIGKTGSTGLAGGDHLHFGMLVHGIFVNPLEWWDARWIENNINDKIRLAGSH